MRGWAYLPAKRNAGAHFIAGQPLLATHPQGPRLRTACRQEVTVDPGNLVAWTAAADAGLVHLCKDCCEAIVPDPTLWDLTEDGPCTCEACTPRLHRRDSVTPEQHAALVALEEGTQEAARRRAKP